MFDPQGDPAVDRATFEVFQVQLEALSGDGSIAAAIAPATAPAHHADDATRTTDLGRYLKPVTKNAALDLVLSIADGREEWRVLVGAYGVRAFSRMAPARTTPSPTSRNSRGMTIRRTRRSARVFSTCSGKSVPQPPPRCRAFSPLAARRDQAAARA